MPAKKGPEVHEEQKLTAPEVKEKAKTDLEALRTAAKLPEKVRNFTDPERERFKKATGKEKLDLATIQNMSLEELMVAEEKDPGLSSMLLGTANEKEKTTEFDSRGNESFEWNVGLRDLTKANVREVTLSIHPNNLDKGNNSKLLSSPEAKRIFDQYKNSGKVEFYQRKSDMREGLKGDFNNAQGYLRIFSGDHYKETKIISDAEVAQLKTTLKSKGEQDARYLKSKGISYMPASYSPGAGGTLETPARNPDVTIDGVDWQALSQEVQLNNHIRSAQDVKSRMPNFYTLIGKIAAMTGIPKAYYFATAEIESNFRTRAVGDTSIGNSKTIWQFYASFGQMNKGMMEGGAWTSSTKSEFFKQKSQEWLGKSVWKRAENAVADALAMASSTMNNARTAGINLNEKVSYRDLVLLRASHNGGPGMGRRVRRDVDAYFNGTKSKDDCGQYAQKYINFAAICKKYNEGERQV